MLLILAGLCSPRSFPDIFAKPFLVIAGALLLPPVWAQVAKKWPTVSRLSTLIRTAACVLAFAMVALVMPKTPVQSEGRNSDANSAAPAAGPQVVPATLDRHEVTITRGEYGEAWPFTVDSGVLRGKALGVKLSNGTELAEVTFTTGGKTYYANGTAKGTNRYAELDDIWAAEGTWSKKSMWPITDRGLKLARGLMSLS